MPVQLSHDIGDVLCRLGERPQQTTKPRSTTSNLGTNVLGSTPDATREAHSASSDSLGPLVALWQSSHLVAATTLDAVTTD